MYTYLQLPIVNSSQLRPDELGGRKEVTFVTHVHETTSWDLSQLVLELDTKTAELSILQSLLEQNDNTLCVWPVFMSDAKIFSQCLLFI
jgi:hypothetical protein